MLSAMNDEQGDDDMHCGNETLAAFMLHHCMHVSLTGYKKLDPFRCGPPPLFSIHSRFPQIGWPQIVGMLQYFTSSAVKNGGWCPQIGS